MQICSGRHPAGDVVAYRESDPLEVLLPGVDAASRSRECLAGERLGEDGGALAVIAPVANPREGEASVARPRPAQKVLASPLLFGDGPCTLPLQFLCAQVLLRLTSSNMMEGKRPMDAAISRRLFLVRSPFRSRACPLW